MQFFWPEKLSKCSDKHLFDLAPYDTFDYSNQYKIFYTGCLKPSVHPF